MVKYNKRLNKPNKDLIFRKSKDGVVFDLEFSFTEKGSKRTDSFIMELGAISLKNKNKKYSHLINPFTKVENGRDLINQLINMKQNPKKTIHFWLKVLLKKNLISKDFISKMRMTTQAEYLSKIIKKSIEHNKKIINSNRISKYTNVIKLIEESKNKPDVIMYPPKLVLNGFKTFINHHSNILYAHNGFSADYKVIEGVSKKYNIDFKNIKKCDTLKYLRNKYPNIKEICGYSQPNLYEYFFNDEYNAHVAIDDAIALRKILLHTLEN
jgi:DNA polymerase III epsilon subunit-like protein